MESETKGRTKQWTHFSCQLGATTFSRFVTTWTTIVINDTLQSSTSVIMLSFEAPSIIPTVFNAVKQISVSLCYLITTTSLKKYWINSPLYAYCSPSQQILRYQCLKLIFVLKVVKFATNAKVDSELAGPTL